MFRPYLGLVAGVIITAFTTTRVVALGDQIVRSTVVRVQSEFLLAVDFANVILQAVVLVVVALHIGPLHREGPLVSSS